MKPFISRSLTGLPSDLPTAIPVSNKQRSGRSVFSFHVIIFCLLAAGTLPLDALAQVTGISYTLSPTGTRVKWDGATGLKDGFLYGGELGFGFGEYVELSALYLTGSDFKTDWRDWSKRDGYETLVDFPSRKLNMSQYGGRLRVNFSRGQFVPFVMLGTGVISFDPDDLEKSENIYAEGGIGLTFAVANRYTISVTAGSQVFRFNPASAFLSDIELESLLLMREDFEKQSVYNPTLSASLKFYLGGRRAEGLTDVDRALMAQFRGGNFGLAVEPFYGQIKFNKALDFPDQQRLGGVNVGFDLGPYLGLRGFYWQGVSENDPFEIENIRFYGGEIDFRFQQEMGASLIPYLTFGGGYMDINRDKYEAETSFAPENRYFAVAGGGVEVPLSSALTIQGGIRSLLMSVDQIEDVTQPSSVYGSFMYTVGMNFNLGRRGRTVGSVLTAEGEAARRRGDDREAALDVQLAAMKARMDSLETAQASFTNAIVTEIQMAAAESDTSAAEPLISRIAARLDTVFVPVERKSNLSGQTITIPVPEEGEIYIRFGPPVESKTETVYAPPVMIGMQPQMMGAPGAAAVYVDTTGAPVLTEDQIRTIINQTAAEWQVKQGISSEELEESLRRLESRMDQRIRQEAQRNRTFVEPAARQQPTEVDIRVSTEDSVVVVSRSPFGRYGRSRMVAIHPMIGLRTGDGPDQFMLGAQAKVLFARKRFAFLPEYAVGFGEKKVGHSLFANLAWELGGSATLRPYVGAGLGFVSNRGLKGLQMSFNILLGAEFTARGGSTWFAQLSTLDFFDMNRIFVGYRLGL